MGNISNHSHQDYWLRLASKVARRINLGWWIERMSAPLMVTSLLIGCTALILRREIPGISSLYLIVATLGALIILGVSCWIIASRKFESQEKALVRIEAGMQMKNSLSTALAGIAPWPEQVTEIHSGLRWQWPRMLVPPLGAILVLTASFLIPVSSANTRITGTPEQPQAWKKLDTALEVLTKEEAVDEKYLEETRKRLDELKSQEEEQWFSHSSLEATDSLKKSHTAETQRMERDLARTEKALDQLEKMAGTATQAEKNRMMEEFEQALQGLQNGAMKPNPKLLEQLQGLDPQNLAKLSPEQLQQLKDNLQKNQAAMKQGSAGEGDDWSDELLADQSSEGENGEGQDGEGMGQGGIQRGPGHAPGVLGNEKDALDLGELTGLQTKDLSKSTLGDLLELQNGEHDLDDSASTLSAGGQADSTGKGGDRVWRDALDPAEQKTLKRYFE